MTKFKIRIGGYTITDQTQKALINSLKKQYPHLSKLLKDGKGTERQAGE